MLSLQIPSADLAPAGPGIKAVTSHKLVRIMLIVLVLAQLKKLQFCQDMDLFSTGCHTDIRTCFALMDMISRDIHVHCVNHKKTGAQSESSIMFLCLTYEGIKDAGRGDISHPHCHILCCQITKHTVTCN